MLPRPIDPAGKINQCNLRKQEGSAIRDFDCCNMLRRKARPPSLISFESDHRAASDETSIQTATYRSPPLTTRSALMVESKDRSHAFCRTVDMLSEGRRVERRG